MAHIVYATRSRATRAQATRINARVAEIDPCMVFVRHQAAGNDVCGWLETGHEGTHDQPERCENDGRCVDIVRDTLG